MAEQNRVNNSRKSLGTHLLQGQAAQENMVAVWKWHLTEWFSRVEIRFIKSLDIWKCTEIRNLFNIKKRYEHNVKVIKLKFICHISLASLGQVIVFGGVLLFVQVLETKRLTAIALNASLSSRVSAANNDNSLLSKQSAI